MKEWYSENGIKINSNKTQYFLFATPNFNKRTETFQITIDDTARHMEDKVKNLGVIFDSRLSFEHHIKLLCSQLNGTLSYLNRVKNTLDQMSRILLIIFNALIFSHLNYCSSIWGKCSEKLQYEVQKCINFAAKVASNGKYLIRDQVTPLLRDLKWINFNSILQLNEGSFIYKILYVSADSNVKKINFGLRNMVSQRITRNFSDVHIVYRRTTVGQKAASVSCAKLWNSNSKFNYHRYVQKAYVPTPLRAPKTTWEQTQTFLIKH